MPSGRLPRIDSIIDNRMRSTKPAPTDEQEQRAEPAEPTPPPMAKYRPGQRDKRKAVIRECMRAGWLGWNAKIKRELRERWGVGVDYMKELAAEVSREVCTEVLEPETLRRDLASLSRIGIEDAIRRGNARQFERCANVYMKAAGLIGAPAKQELTLNQQTTLVQVSPDQHAAAARARESMRRVFAGAVDVTPSLPPPELAELGDE